MSNNDGSGNNRANTGRKVASSPSVAARRAKGLQMLRDGRRVVEVAEALGVGRTTVKRWQAEANLREKVAAETEALESARAEAASRAREMVSAATPAMAQIVIGIASGKITGRADVMRVRLEAAKTALDRGGVPARSEVEQDHKGSLADTLVSAIDQALKGQG